MAFEAALKMDVSGFTAGANKAAESVNKLSATVMGLAALKVAGEALSAVAQAVSAQFQRMYAAMEAGGSLVDLAEQTGLAVDKLMVLQTAFTQAGMGAGDVQPVINKMQKAIEAAATSGGPAADAFNRLGLSANYLSSLNAEDQLKLIGDAINRIPNPAQRAAVAMEVFGKSGGKLLSLFGAGGLDEAAVAVGNQARLMRENAGVFDKVTDVLGTAATKLQGLYVGVASTVAPMLMEAVDAFNSIDLSGLGQQIGTIVSLVLEAFSENKLGTLVFEALRYGFVASVNIMARLLSATLAAAVQVLVDGFKLITTAKFWEGMLFALVGIAQTFIEKLANGFAYILEQWAGIPMIGEDLAKTAKDVKEYARMVGSRGDMNLNYAQIQLEPMLGTVGKNIQAAVKEAYATAPQMEQGKGLADVVAGLKVNFESKNAAVRAQNTYTAPTSIGAEITQQKQTLGFDFVSSLTKIGGNQFGPSTGQDPALNIQRQQLETQRRLADRADITNMLLKELQQRSSGGTVYQ